MSTTHRLPTVTAAEALQASVETEDATVIKLGLPRLDRLLAGTLSASDGADDDTSSGLLCGEVVEIIGPPGVGKTALWCVQGSLHKRGDAVHKTNEHSMQAAAATLVSGRGVAWIDTGTTLVSTRLKSFLESRIQETRGTSEESDDTAKSLDECLSRLRHFTAPSLPHLLALLFHAPAATFPHAETGLIVIDTISAPIDASYPRNAEDRGRGRNSGGGEGARWLTGRRQSIMADVGARLGKLAAVQGAGVLVTTNMVTRIRTGHEATLQAALSGWEWEQSISRRVCLYRDWARRGGGSGGSGRGIEAARFARTLPGRDDRGAAWHEVEGAAVAFEIGGGGLCEIDDADMEQVHGGAGLARGPAPDGRSRKRSRAVGGEESGSDEASDEFGWDELGDEDVVGTSFA